MTPTPNSHQRDFIIIAFLHREGRVYLQDLEEFNLSTADDCAGYCLRRTRLHMAQGDQVIVLESGSIKPDWSRLDYKGFCALMGMSADGFKRLTGRLRHHSLGALADFQQHVARTFPQHHARRTGHLPAASAAPHPG